MYRLKLYMASVYRKEEPGIAIRLYRDFYAQVRIWKAAVDAVCGPRGEQGEKIW